jgi:hypothetical protein
MNVDRDAQALKRGEAFIMDSAAPRLIALALASTSAVN